jgi:adenosylmethionine---8-amino-7-oxononanoate aminotransferase
LLSTCSANDVICIADEVMTGFGRTGKAFASHYIKARPDIICLSKGLTGGTMALGVTACTAKIAAAFDTDDKLKTFFHGHSFTANPIACTAALASLELLQKTDCMIRIETIAAAHRKFMEALSNIDKVINARATGTIIAFEVSYGQHEYLNEVSKMITAFMLGRGVYVRPLGNTLYLMPPYCITVAELETVYQAILECLEMIGK